jgi:hypothetical protein
MALTSSSLERAWSAVPRFDLAPTVTFTGTRAGGGTVTQTFTVTTAPGVQAFQSFTFAGFSDLVSLQ